MLEEKLMEAFCWFHQHPELSYEEYETTARIREYLEEAGIEILPARLETGLAAVIRGAQEGPVRALRCDIDALPITEETDLPYRSQYPGKMHACGHDFHITAGLGTAILLQENRKNLKGEVRIIFQPAEESSLGALKILETDLMKGVEQIWGIHSDPTNPVNTIGIREGYVAAAVDRFVITIKGTGCHGAHPDDGIDPIPAAAAMVQALQTIVSRNVNAFHPSLLSVTRIQAGNTWNVIPETAELEGTVRTMDKNDRELYKKRLQEIAGQTALAYGARAEVRWIPGPPAVYNDLRMAGQASGIAKDMGFAIAEEEQSLGGDDFSFYEQDIPGCYIKIGTGRGPLIHQPGFQIDRRTLFPTAKYLSALLISSAER